MREKRDTERDLTSIILVSRDILREAVSNALTVHWIGIISPGAGISKPLKNKKEQTAVLQTTEVTLLHAAGRNVSDSIQRSI